MPAFLVAARGLRGGPGRGADLERGCTLPEAEGVSFRHPARQVGEEWGRHSMASASEAAHPHKLHMPEGYYELTYLDNPIYERHVFPAGCLLYASPSNPGALAAAGMIQTATIGLTVTAEPPHASKLAAASREVAKKDQDRSTHASWKGSG